MIDAESSHRVLVWDRSTRLFHWCLATCTVLLLLTGYLGMIRPHVWMGQATVGMLTFRLAWGWLGSQTARFADFVAGPTCVWNYLRHGAPYHLGHNPLGGWMVLALLLLLVIQVATGLIGTGDGLNGGPLAHWVSALTSAQAYEIHATLAVVLLVLALIHVGAVLFHRMAWGHDLIGPMIHGFKVVPIALPAPRRASAARAAASWILAVSVLALMSLLGRGG